MASIPQKLRPWIIPNHALIEGRPGKRQDGFRQAETISVEKLPEGVLDEMVGEWIEELYKKAGEPSPWVKAS